MTRRRKLIWRLFFSYIAITLGALLAVGWYTLRSLEHFLSDQSADALVDRARLIESQILPLLDGPDAAAIDDVCKRAGLASDTRFTVILPDGIVLGDTHEMPQNMDNHASRPEVAAALAEGIGRSVRFSTTLQRNISYAAVRAGGHLQPKAVIRAAVPTVWMEGQLTTIRWEILVIGFIIAVLALGFTLAISRQYSLMIKGLEQGAERFAEGELAHRLEAPGAEELAGLAEALNRMAAQLESRLQAIVGQRNQLEAVLSSMLEGVIAVDRQERIISINPAAARWFDIDAEKARGRNILEVIRNLAIQRFVAKALASREPIQDDIQVFQNGEKVLNIKSAPLLDVGPDPIGLLVVFTDVTQLRRLEDMRRDFVANVSHEIKTPLTAIKGFVETLHQGIVDNPEEARRFLGIVSKHVDRLNTIIEDLLMLSRIEEEGERGELKREKTALREIFQNAAQLCRPKAEAKGIRIHLSGGEPPTAVVDPVLLEQALVNLLDNAIKYSEPDRSVHLEAHSGPHDIRIRVLDHGIGIEKKHLPRLFERFYRVDKARSRGLGGTGLGLAIVKHIAQAHGGRVTVESTLGEGSAFTIHLPRDPGSA
jgi:two-component system phosphate regulon sensor histidine kinase PhoR